MKLPDIIGIAGTNGSGKDTLAELREELQGALNTSLSDVLRREATKRGLSHERKNLRAISTEWENELGEGALVQKVLEYYQSERGGRGGLSISSVRRVTEAKAIKQAGGVIVWVDADQRQRYDRIAARNRSDDTISFEEFAEQERAELFNTTKAKGALETGKIADIADIKIYNDFSSKQEYEDYLKEFFGLGS